VKHCKFLEEGKEKEGKRMRKGRKKEMGREKEGKGRVRGKRKEEGEGR
jgi:hypothetical protein